MAQHSLRWYKEEIQNIERLIATKTNKKAIADLTRYKARLFKEMSTKYGVKVINGKVQGGKNESL